MAFELPNLKQVGKAASDHWVLVAAGAGITTFASGLAYTKGYFGTLGFDGLVLSFPSEHYAVVGAMALAGMALVLGVVLALFLTPPMRKLFSSGRDDDAPRRVERIRWEWVLLAAAVLLLAVFMATWRWLAPMAITRLFHQPGLIKGVEFLVAFALMLAAFPIALGRLKGQAAIALALALALVAAPVLAHRMGERRAENLVEDVFHAPRVVVWRNETSPPERYVVAHQDGDALYLVQVLDAEQNRLPAFRSTVLHMSSVARVDFIPAGGDDSYAFRSETPA